MAFYPIEEHEYRYRPLGGSFIAWTPCTAEMARPNNRVSLPLPDIDIAEGDVQVRVMASGARPAGSILASPAAFTLTPEVDITPTAPTWAFDTGTRILSLSHPDYAAGELETSEDGTTWSAYAQLLVDGNAHAEGEWQGRVKAAEGRSAGAIADSPAISFQDTPDTIPSPVTSIYNQTNGNSLIAAQGSDAAKTVYSRLQALVYQTVPTVYGQNFGFNGMRWDEMLSANNMRNYVYNPYFQQPGQIKFLTAFEWINSHSAGATKEQNLDMAWDFVSKARNKDNSNPDFTANTDGTGAAGAWRVGLITPTDCNRAGYRANLPFWNEQVKANYRQYANFIVDISENPYIGVSGSADNTTFYLDGTHHTELGELVLADEIRKAEMNYLGLAIPDDLADLAATKDGTTVTATVTSSSFIEFRISVDGGTFGAWQGTGVFTGINSDTYTVEARMYVKPATTLSKSYPEEVVYEAETVAHINRVTAASGSVPNPDFVNSFILHAKANGYWDKVIWAGGAVTGLYDSGSGLIKAMGIKGVDLVSPSSTRVPAIVTTSADRKTFLFEGQQTAGTNDILYNSIGQTDSDKINGTNSFAMVALSKIDVFTTTSGMAAMNFAEPGEMMIGADAPGTKYIAVRKGVVLFSNAANSGAWSVIGANFNSTSKNLDLWINGVKDNTVNIPTPTAIPTTSTNLGIGAGLHTVAMKGEQEFAMLLSDGVTDTVMQAIHSFINSELPH